MIYSVKDRKMKKLVLAASVATMLSASVQADMLLGLYIGGQVWNAAASGTFGENDGQGNIVLQDFTLADQAQTSFHVALEHPIPLVPNIKIASTTLDTDGSNTIDDGFSFGDIAFPAGAGANTTFNMSYIDYTLYYEILDNDLITFDIGITARDFDGDINVSTVDFDPVFSERVDVAVVVPMLYASVIVGLPFTGVNFFAEGNMVSYDGSGIYDYQVGVSYAVLDNVLVDLDVTLGYRSVKLDLDDLDGLHADLTFDGVYLGTIIHF